MRGVVHKKVLIWRNWKIKEKSHQSHKDFSPTRSRSLNFVLINAITVHQSKNIYTMKTYFGLMVFLLVLALAMISPSSQDVCRQDIKDYLSELIYVHVCNNLSSRNTLFLHYKSKDDDLGRPRSSGWGWILLEIPSKLCGNNAFLVLRA